MCVRERGRTSNKIFYETVGLIIESYHEQFVYGDDVLTVDEVKISVIKCSLISTFTLVGKATVLITKKIYFTDVRTDRVSVSSILEL